MKIEIIPRLFDITLIGIGGPVDNHDFAGSGMELMKILFEKKASESPDLKGRIVWMYPDFDSLFVAFESEDNSNPDSLEKRTLHFSEYAYYKHIGPYSQLGKIHSEMENELKHRGFANTIPRLEIYGDWTEDESKLETEVLMCLK